jgi:hypothetical protein
MSLITLSLASQIVPPINTNSIKVVTDTSARCCPDAMNEKFRKVDTHLHYRAIQREFLRDPCRRKMIEMTFNIC